MSWDGYLSYDGVLYGLPSSPPVAGSVVQVYERRDLLWIWSQGQCIAQVAKRPRSQECVQHPDQFRGVQSASSLRSKVVPLGHQRPIPEVMRRALTEYDQLYGVEVGSCNRN